MKQNSQVTWGISGLGYAALGIIEIVSNETDAFNYCLDCGTTWRASDAFAVLKSIEILLGCQLDIAHEKDRDLMNKFLEDFVPQFVKIKHEKGLIKSSLVALGSQENYHLLTNKGLIIGILISFLLVVLMAFISAYLRETILILMGVILAFVSPVVGIYYDNFVSKKSKKRKWIEKREARLKELRSSQIQLEAKLNEANIKIEQLIEQFKAGCESEV
nr:hypothetical protein DOP62_04615 [Synechococcus elongatus PCC 11801]